MVNIQDAMDAESMELLWLHGVRQLVAERLVGILNRPVSRFVGAQNFRYTGTVKWASQRLSSS